MLAKFEDKEDKKRVITEGPSNFDMSLILLKEFDGIQQACSLFITEALFWARVHDLSMMARNEYVGGGLTGNFIEQLEGVDVEVGDVA